MKYRIGNGYDAHRLEAGQRLILGGVEIPFEKGLLGHSDADVLVHAVMDSILGALALGDIGKLFPDSDGSYKGISSLELLRKTGFVMRKAGFSIGNIDTVIIAQEPKLSPYIDTMRKNIAQELKCRYDRVSVKATTEEFLGFTGEGRGMAAHAVCMLFKRRNVPLG